MPVTLTCADDPPTSSLDLVPGHLIAMTSLDESDLRAITSQRRLLEITEARGNACHDERGPE
jgi:hypothetical protein